MRQSVEPELVLNYAGGVDWRIAQRGGANRRGLAGVAANPLTIALNDLGAAGCSQPREIHSRAVHARGQGVAGRSAGGAARYRRMGRELGLDPIRDVELSPGAGRGRTGAIARRRGARCRRSSPHFAYLGERRKGRLSYVCTISHPDPASVLMLSDKQTRVRARVRRKLPTFASIEPTRVCETQCISVSHPSSLYITDDYVVTHNTALALNIGENVALHHKKPVVVFSMEMGATQLALRMIGSVGRLDQHKLRTGRLRTGGLGQTVDRARIAERSADPHRRNARAQRHRSPLARSADHEAARRAGSRDRRLSAADAVVDRKARTARRRFRRSRAR